MDSQLISVIVPVYKVEKYLDRCVESIVNQTYRNLEIILVDDGSPDNCPAMCDAWAEKDIRIKVIHKENGGVSSARNRGLDIATGEYIGFVDSDDYVESEMYEILIAAMLNNSADIVICSNTHVNENGNEIDDGTKNADSFFEGNDVIKTFLEGDKYDTTATWNKCYSRAVATHFDEAVKIGEDLLFNYTAFKQANRVVVTEDCLYNYTFHDDSAMRSGNYYVISRWKVIREIANNERKGPNYWIAVRKLASELSCVTRELIRAGNAELVDICYPEIVLEVKNDFAEFESIKKEINKKVFASLKMMNRAPNMFLKAMRLYYKIRG